MAIVEISYPKENLLKICLNDPENLNAMSEKMAAEFNQVVRQLTNQNKFPRLIVIQGSGRAFSAGGDLAMLQGKIEKSFQDNLNGMLNFYRSFLDLLKIPVPILAILNGPTIGAGLCLACACDFRYATADAKLGFTFTKLGLHPGMGGTYILPKLIGNNLAKELMITGRILSANDALSAGLISKIIPSEKSETVINELLDEIEGTSRFAVSQLLETLRPNPEDLEIALSREAYCQAQNYANEDFKEGICALLEKRKPKYF